MENRFNPKLKWNTDVVLWHAVEYDFPVRQCSEHHMRLKHPILGYLNYWPSSGKGQWDAKGLGCYNKSFVIPDIERFLQRYFFPLQ